VSDFYEITVPATEQPVKLEDVKNFCKVETTVDDALLTTLIEAAVDQLEAFTNRVFVERTFVGKFNCLRTSKYESYPFLELRRAPLKSVTGMTVEIDGSKDAFTDFLVKEESSFARLLITEDTGVLDDVAYPIEVTFVAGYGTVADVPNPLKLAIYQYILFLYENRGDAMAAGGLSMPKETQRIAKRYRVMATYG
jgi:uncharacterized phiE125 gp8 family phage protein